MPSLHERYQGCSQQGLSVQGAALQFHLQLSGKSRTHTNPVLVDHRNELALEICGGGFCRRLVRLHHVALVRWFDHKYTKLLPDLVDTTAKNFTISEISADKGYGSVKNYKAIQRHGAVPYIAHLKAFIQGAPRASLASLSRISTAVTMLVLTPHIRWTFTHSCCCRSVPGKRCFTTSNFVVMNFWLITTSAATLSPHFQ